MIAGEVYRVRTSLTPEQRMAHGLPAHPVVETPANPAEAKDSEKPGKAEERAKKPK